jgi:hypothetical protein
MREADPSDDAVELGGRIVGTTPAGGQSMVVTIGTRCCGREMQALGLVDVSCVAAESAQRWLCPVCHHGLDVVHYYVDEEEFENQLALYAGAGESAGAAGASGQGESLDLVAAFLNGNWPALPAPAAEGGGSRGAAAGHASEVGGGGA